LVFNPRSEQGEIISHRKWQILQARAEVDQEGKKLKPLPLPMKSLGPKIDYYIEMWKMGTAVDKVIATIFSTANIKHAVKLIYRANHTVLFLQRSHDAKVLWNQR
jgi:hypothetical protein